MVLHLEEGVFWGSTVLLPRGPTEIIIFVLTNSINILIFGPLYICLHGMIYTDQILHGNQIMESPHLKAQGQTLPPQFFWDPQCMATLFYLGDQIWQVSRLRNGKTVECGYVKVFTRTTMLHTETTGPIVQNLWNC